MDIMFRHVRRLYERAASVAFLRFLIKRRAQKLYVAKVPRANSPKPDEVMSSFITSPPVFAEWTGYSFSASDAEVFAARAFSTETVPSGPKLIWVRPFGVHSND